MITPDQIAQVDAAEASALAGAGALLLDVREPDEWSAGHIPGATHTPLGMLDARSVPADRVVVAVCRSGNRSGKAAVQLAECGHDVRNLAGGMKAWAAEGRPVTRDDGTSGTVV